jgi:hypothetical protein
MDRCGFGRIRGPCGPVVLSAVASRVGCTAGRSAGWLTLRWPGGSGDLPRVRRFFCDGEACGLRTFVEQVSGLTTGYARRTLLMRGMLESIGLALAGWVGTRLATALGLPASRSTLLRLM